MKRFARLFQTERGQVLLMRCADDNNDPEIAIYFTPAADCVGLCRVAVSGFGDDDDADEKADKAFESITDDQAIAMAFMQMDQIEAMFQEQS